MRIKCDDGIVRNFAPTKECWQTFSSGELEESKRPYKVFQGYDESMCLECGKLFGVHDTKYIKPEWKKHICKVLSIPNT